KNVGSGWEINDLPALLRVTGWSLTYDVMSLFLLNLPFFILLLLFQPFHLKGRVAVITAIFFTLLNTVAVLLNIADIFYYHFHLQRADADLLYVLQNPLSKTFRPHFFISILTTAFCILLAIFIYHLIKKIIQHYKSGTVFIIIPVFITFLLALFLISGIRKAVPTYPLVNVTASQLPLTQNSLHTFLYSIYRKNELTVNPLQYMSPEDARKIFPLTRKIVPDSPGIKKNIVLFIMESIPEDFFNPGSRYKVSMPFLDSVVAKSTYFKNAYSYSHSSNNGIVAILAGLPTLTQIPVYHSGYTNIPFTHIGKKLSENNYSSSFFIGDHYDDFGFAKCCNWLGIKYHSMENVPGYKNMEKHAMGLHDEYMLSYVLQKSGEIKQPFFITYFNISTHFPNTLPSTFKEHLNEKNFTAEMKSMNYYSECLRSFFEAALKKEWYKNSVFIFVADHWMCPDYRDVNLDVVESFHIPLFIYNPMQEIKTVVTKPVSQLDILNTILSYTGSADSITSYGNQLDTTHTTGGTVFCKENSVLYEAIDSSYVLGFNVVTGLPEFCYNFRTDIKRKNNLVKQPGNERVQSLTLKMKAFLQVASSHYKGHL
ncbi:MAG TPA: LTA synthase family protein, partial [Ferruginibacter sp.]|nr:LTA synthase family protein [Ferruginibacter sp.]